MEKLSRCNDFMKNRCSRCKKNPSLASIMVYTLTYIMNMWRIVLKYQINGNCCSSNTLSLKIKKIVPG